MPSTLNISLPDPLMAYVDAQIEAGDYRTPSEYIHDLIRHDHERKVAETGRELAELELRLLKAVADEDGAIDLTPEQVRGGGIVSLIRERIHAAR